MTTAARRTVIVDFDGTITEQDMLYELATRHTPEATAEAERALLAGEIDVNECVRREFEPIHAEHEDMLAEMVAEAKVRPGFAAFVRSAQAAGDRVIVVSSGFEELIRPVLASVGVTDLEVLAHNVRFSPQGTTVNLHPRALCERCGERCKRSLVAEIADGTPVAYVGDGWSDHCASLAAEQRFARSGLARYLDSEGADYIHFETFADVSAGLGD